MASLTQRIKTALPFNSVQELILPVGIVLSVFVILVTLPPGVMDLLLAANITISIIILLSTIYVKTPLEFSIFPTLLLATTLMRLVLNVATTRLILTRAEADGQEAAGHVIQAFSNFVAGDKIVVGIIIFSIIVIIQFVVITKGATRISEVAARFALDGMPGRQMAIDADLNAGIIDEHEAQRRRTEITEQADFFGSMDGASKFVRGDAIAGIIITLINVVGGLFIGVVEAGMSVSEAAALFTRLTIGDGLVSQVPAFLISLAAGLLVTRSSNESDLPDQFVRQLFARAEAMAIAGVFLIALIFTNLPTIPLMTIGLACCGLAAVLTQKDAEREREQVAKEKEEAEAAPEESRIEDYLTVDPMEMEIGVGLIRLADPNRGGDLLERIQRIRQNVASDIGIILPKVRIRDSFQLDQHQYRIKIDGMPVADGMVFPGMYLAIDSGMTTGEVPGTPTTDPAFGTPALWIDEATRDQAEMNGYTVVDPGAVIATHLTETVRKHADELLTRDATQHLIDEMKESHPAVVEELIPGVMKLSGVQQVLQTLLKEQVPIRQLGLILQTLGDYAQKIADPILLTEYVRAKLARTLCSRYRTPEGTMHVVTLDPGLEDAVRAGFEHNERGLFIRMTPQATEALNLAIRDAVEKLMMANRPPILLVSPPIRPAVREITATQLPQLIVLSYNEITRDTRIESVAMVNAQ